MGNGIVQCGNLNLLWEINIHVKIHVKYTH
jgi:hypothetical protein